MITGCGDTPQGPAPDDAQRDELLERASLLQDRVRESGEPTASDRLEFESIRTAMVGWSELTGRTDLKVCDEEEQRLVSAARIDTGRRPGPGSITCQPCASVTYQFGMLCFLVDQQCDPFTGSRICVYNCIPTNHPWLS